MSAEQLFRIPNLMIVARTQCGRLELMCIHASPRMIQEWVEDKTDVLV